MLYLVSWSKPSNSVLPEVELVSFLITKFYNNDVYLWWKQPLSAGISLTSFENITINSIYLIFIWSLLGYVKKQ